MDGPVSEPNRETVPVLNDHQATVMDLFADKKSLWHVADLAEELGTTTSGAARTANVLDRLGLVELVAYPPAKYYVTPKGQAWWEANRTYNPVRSGSVEGSHA
jgi:Mn-dependent DtxR family transcriptional regulator